MGASSLLVIRHGHAIAASGRDRDRPLSDAGRAAVAEVGRILAAAGKLPPTLHASPYVRARETAEILARALSPAASVRLTRSLEPDEDPDAAIEELLGGSGPSACVSHMPMVGRIVLALARGAREPTFVPGGAALVTLSAGLPSPRGRLSWIASPEDLAACLRGAEGP